MRKTFGFTVAAAAAILAVTGCHSTGKVKADEASLSANPEMAKAQQQIQACVSRDGFLTKNDRSNLVSCIAPGGSKVKVETCIQAAVSKDGLLLTRADRQKFEDTDAPTCVVNNG